MLNLSIYRNQSEYHDIGKWRRWAIAF